MAHFFLCNVCSATVSRFVHPWVNCAKNVYVQVLMLGPIMFTILASILRKVLSTAPHRAGSQLFAGLQAQALILKPETPCKPQALNHAASSRDGYGPCCCWAASDFPLQGPESSCVAGSRLGCHGPRSDFYWRRTQTYKHKTWVRCLRKSLTDIPACPGTLSNSAR